MIQSEMLILDTKTINFTISLKLSQVINGLSEFTRETKEEIDKPLSLLNKVNTENIWKTLNYLKNYPKFINMLKKSKNDLKLKIYYYLKQFSTLTY
jgi:hypothetical protein